MVGASCGSQEGRWFNSSRSYHFTPHPRLTTPCRRCRLVVLTPLTYDQGLSTRSNTVGWDYSGTKPFVDIVVVKALAGV